MREPARMAVGPRRELCYRRPWMKHVLFVCSQNELRSPTAEALFSGRGDVAVASAGLNHDAPQPLTPGLLAWADVIFVMEKAHLSRIRKRFRRYLNRQRLICLDIPDLYGYMDPALVELLEAKVPRYLGLPRPKRRQTTS